jgi:hypothetical protein
MPIMSAAHAMARAMAAGLAIDDASRRYGRTAALMGRPAWDCPEGFDRLSYFLGHAEGKAERMCHPSEPVAAERLQ